MSGLEAFMVVAWHCLKKHHGMDEPVAANVYPGCNHSYSNFKSNADLAKTVLYDRMAYLISSVNLYQKVCVDATGKEATLRNVATPFVESGHTLVVAKAPVANGPCIECEWCGHGSLVTVIARARAMI